ncbi:uncharacterized protein A4U43_C05F15530 [Asparagus officinalis]|uniref:Uncharacterized protein n=1 Tax=Asparagus officinalis TaxID=4686 RepID=A0A5P1EUC7_ASPOF|nr:uncharacterized protein LOC109843698 [Asparagus officinalis]XP_020268241.1 uncharacterized protein LOC109843698 [Asparagus officinalis]ONK68747.1 uncharacterized protein A4U43_C05F15530 [Asparagus officinalis]
MEMQDPRLVSPDEATHLKPKKKKPLNQVAPTIQKKGEAYKGKETLHPPSKTKKVSKKVTKADTSPHLQQMNALTPDSIIPEASISSGDYRALRHKYLLLEEESLSLDRELNKAEGEVKTLEDEKLALLDQLVVLEGLIDPSEIKSQGKL